MSRGPWDLSCLFSVFLSCFPLRPVTVCSWTLLSLIFLSTYNKSWSNLSQSSCLRTYFISFHLSIYIFIKHPPPSTAMISIATCLIIYLILGLRMGLSSSRSLKTIFEWIKQWVSFPNFSFFPQLFLLKALNTKQERRERSSFCPFECIFGERR